MHRKHIFSLLVEVILSLMLISIVTGGDVNAQEEDDPIYLPLILKNFDPSQPYHYLSVRKTAWPNPVQAGELLTYTIRYSVGGNEPAPGLTLVDTLPQSTTYQSCAGGQSCLGSADHVTWSLGDVTPYAAGLVTLTVRTDRSIITGTALYNTATLSDASGLTRTTTVSAPVQNGPSRDIALIFDISGSMQYDIVCHGCYEQFGDGDPGRPELPWPYLNYGYDYPIYGPIAAYPHTFIHPLPIDHLPRDAYDGTDNGGIGNNDPGEADDGLCYGRDDNEVGYVEITGGGDPQFFIVIEAELYTRNNSSYQTAFRQPGQGYWAVQHATYRTVDRMFSSSPDNSSFLTGATPILPGEYDRGSWMSHHPFMLISREEIGTEGEPGYLPEVLFGANYGIDDARSNISPSLDYEFITTADEGDGGWDGRDDTEGSHIYARLQGGDVYWAVYPTPPGPGADPLDPAPLGSGDIERDTEPSLTDPQYGGAQKSQWRWIELTEDNGSDLDLEAGYKYTLRIWAGQAGLDIDQIVIANTTDRSQIFDAGYSNGATYPDNVKLHATAGSAFGQACNRCNPIYGQLIADPADCLPPFDNEASQVGSRYYDAATGQYDLRKDEIFGGYQPLRGAKEAVKRYIADRDPGGLLV